MAIVDYEIRDKVAIVTLNEPEKRNPLSQKLVWPLIDRLKDAAADPGVLAVLIAANGDAFCAGGDLKEFQNMKEQAAVDIYEDGRGTTNLLELLGLYPKPVVAAINGPAFGGGFGIALSCPIVVASEKAKFGATEIKLGLWPLVIMPALRTALGDRRAMELTLTAETFDAETAKREGLISKVVPHETLFDEAFAMAAKIATYSPHALKLGYEAFHNTTGLPLGQAVNYMNALRIAFFHSDDVKEGATAFLEKRPAKWVGR